MIAKKQRKLSPPMKNRGETTATRTNSLGLTPVSGSARVRLTQSRSDSDSGVTQPTGGAATATNRKSRQVQGAAVPWTIFFFLFIAFLSVLQNLVASKQADVPKLHFSGVLYNSTANSVSVSTEKNRSISSSSSSSKPTGRTDQHQQQQRRTDARPRGLRLVMIGDSLMRYHYLSLTHFLLHGIWIDENPEHQFFPNGTRKPCPVNPSTYPTKVWNEFLYRTTRLGYEICDCFRLDKPNFNRKTVSENRYFHEPSLDNKVVMFQVLERPQGREDPATAFQQLKNWTYVKTEKPTPMLWKYRLKHGYADIIRNAIRPMGASFQATHAIMNRGLWEGHWFRDEACRIDLLHALQGDNNNNNTHNNNDATTSTTPQQQKPITGIWRTTNYWRYKKLSNLNDDEAMKKFFTEHNQLIMDVSWTRNLSSQYYWDNVHFWEPVYRVWSEEMLEKMGHVFPSDYIKLNKTSLFQTPEQQQGKKKKKK